MIDRKNGEMLKRLDRVNNRPSRFVDLQSSADFNDKVMRDYKEHKYNANLQAAKKRYQDISESNSRISSRIRSQ